MALSDLIAVGDADDFRVDSSGNIIANNAGTPVTKVITGGAAGNHTVTGIATTDQLISVIYDVGAGTDVTDVSELTAEFSISAADTINNAGGTATTAGKMVVSYLDKSL